MKKLIVAAVILFCASSAFGYTMAVSGSDLGTSEATYQNIEFSNNTLILTTTGEAGWTANGKMITTGTQEADAVLLAPDGAGGAFICWREIVMPANKIYFMTDRLDGTSGDNLWAANRTLEATTISTTDGQSIAVSYNGGVIDGLLLAWSNNNTNSAVKCAKLDLNTGYRIWNLTLIESAGGIKDRIQVVSDGAGGAVAVWRDRRDGHEAIFAQRVQDGSPTWESDGVTIESYTISRSKTNPKIVAVKDLGYMVGWIDSLGDAGSLYARALNNSGGFDSSRALVSSLSGKKGSFDLKTMLAPYDTSATFVWTEGAEGSRDVYAQRMSYSGMTPLWGSGAGIAVGAGEADQFGQAMAAQANGETSFTWLDPVSLNGFIQRADVNGGFLYAPSGINLGFPLPVTLVSNESGGVYASAAVTGEGTGTYRPSAQAINSAGQEIWGSSGILLSPYNILVTPLPSNVSALPAVPSGQKSMIAAWTDSRSGTKAVYAQKVTDKYNSSGTYVSKKFYNDDLNFGAWSTLTGEVTGTGTTSIELRTAAGSAALDSAAWIAVAFNGSIPNNGKWIQARAAFAPGAGDTASALSALYFNYSRDNLSPTIESVKADNVTLSASTTSDIAPSPTIEATLTDDAGISTADIKVDDVSVSYSTVSSTSTRWVIRSTITTPLSAGSHTIKVSVTDNAGNTTTNTYNVAVASRPEVKSGSIAGFSEGSKITVAYELNSPADVSIEIRDLTGTLVQKFVVPGGTVGSNSASVDRGALGKGAYIVIITPAGGQPVVGNAVF